MTQKYLNITFRIVISFCAILYSFHIIEVNKIVNIFGNIELNYFLIALFIFNLSKFISAIRLKIFYKCIGFDIDSIDNIKLYYLGMYYNLFLPGSIGGDAYKVYLIKNKTNIKLSKVIQATLMDRISGATFLILLSAILFMFISKSFKIINHSNLIFISILCTILIPILYYFTLKLFLKDFLKYFNKTCILSFFVQIGQMLCAYYLLISIGVVHSFASYLLLFMLSSLAAIFPISIGGIGLRELVFIYGSNYLLIDASLSVAFTILFFFILALSSILGLFYSFQKFNLTSVNKIS